MSAQSNGRTVMAQGRIVWTSGDLFEGKLKTDMNSKQPVYDKAGNQVREYGFGLSIPKASLGDVWVAMHEEAYVLFPNRQIPPNFAMKYKDGDGIDDKGIPFSQREGYANSLVVACTTRLPIKYFKYEGTGNIQINEGIKCGDYVNVQLQIKSHPAQGQAKAGLYINPVAAQLVGYGTHIVNRPDGNTFFGTQAPPMPQGATAMPMASTTGPLVPTGQAMQAPQAYAPQPQAPQAYAPQPQAPQAYAPPSGAVMPNYAVLPPAHQPQTHAQPPGPSFAPQPQYQPQLPGMPVPPTYQQ